jgi:acetolactate decarboxylase
MIRLRPAISSRKVSVALAALLLLVVLAACTASCGGTTGSGSGADSVYQVSTLGALAKGVMVGNTTCGELVKHGDLGLGTFNAMDGEMVVLDGAVYQVPVSGVPRKMKPGELTPFAEVKFFKTLERWSVPKEANLDELKKNIDSRLPTRNYVYAFRLDGTFDHIKARSVREQKPPFPSLEKVVAEQVVFELSNVKGTMVGFFYPDYLAGVNQAGYHFHFLTDDRKAGGHVLDCAVNKASAKMDHASGLEMVFPETAEFKTVDIPGQN